jgi:hypothetical protein
MAWTRLGLRLAAGCLGRAAAAGPSPEFVEQMSAAAEGAESAGFDCLWLPAPAARAALDPFVLGAALATRTSTIRLGCLDWPLGDRSPPMLAKAVASLDVISGGRAAAGVDVGSGEAGAIAEALRIVRLMLEVEAPTFEGGHYRIESAWNEPRRAHPPPVVACVPADSAAPAGDVLDLVDGVAFDWSRRDAPPGAFRIGIVPPALAHMAAGWDALVLDVPAAIELPDVPEFAAQWGRARAAAGGDA